MDRLQRNAGNAGIIAALVLVVFFVLWLTSGLDQQAFVDPATALPSFAQNSTRWALIGIGGALAAGFALVFTAGLYRRLSEKAPTRGFATLLLAVVGSSAFALGSLVQWLGGAQLAATADRVAAGHAWVALAALLAGLEGLGNAFIGAALLVAGWAIIGTGALRAGLGWLAVVGGIISILAVFWATSPVIFLGATILTIAFLAWAGVQLRGA